MLLTKETCYLFAGVIIYIVPWFAVRFTAYKYPIIKKAITKTAYIGEYFLFIGSLFFFAFGIYITIKAGGDIMSPEFKIMAQNLYMVLWILLGVMAGTIIVYIVNFGLALANGIKDAKGRNEN